MDETEAAVSVGVRQLCCREGTNARSFDRGRENLKHAAQIWMGEEQFRQIVESEGKGVLKAGASEQLELDWSGGQCEARTPEGLLSTRMYASADGVKVPTTTQAEKDKRRETVKKWRKDTPRKKRGKLKRLPAVKKGSDQRFKQIYVTIFYDQSQAHRLVGVTCEQLAGLQRLLRGRPLRPLRFWHPRVPVGRCHDIPFRTDSTIEMYRNSARREMRSLDC